MKNVIRNMKEKEELGKVEGEYDERERSDEEKWEVNEQVGGRGKEKQ